MDGCKPFHDAPCSCLGLVDDSIGLDGRGNPFESEVILFGEWFNEETQESFKEEISKVGIGTAYKKHLDGFSEIVAFTLLKAILKNGVMSGAIKFRNNYEWLSVERVSNFANK